MFKNYFLLTKKKQTILPEVFTAKGTHNHKETRFFMYQGDS